MLRSLAKTLAIVMLSGGLVALYAPTASAFNPGDMMNPSKWMGGGNRNYDNDYYGAGPYGAGPYGAGPYGAGPYGAGPYGAGPYGAGPYGAYGSPYGNQGYDGVQPYGVPSYGAPAVATPSAATPTASEVEVLKQRIEQLEAQQRGGVQSTPAATYPSTKPKGW